MTFNEKFIAQTYSSNNLSFILLARRIFARIQFFTHYPYLSFEMWKSAHSRKSMPFRYGNLWSRKLYICKNVLLTLAWHVRLWMVCESWWDIHTWNSKHGNYRSEYITKDLCHAIKIGIRTLRVEKGGLYKSRMHLKSIDWIIKQHMC